MVGQIDCNCTRRICALKSKYTVGYLLCILHHACAVILCSKNMKLLFKKCLLNTVSMYPRAQVHRPNQCSAKKYLKKWSCWNCH